MTTSVDSSYGSWPATTPPFISKYGVVSNLSTGTSSGVVVDPAGAPASLFMNGEQGVWYDPSDFSTMFQDSAGTTPVTAVEQPVGLILDKSKGLALGAELVISDPSFGAVDPSFTASGTGATLVDSPATLVGYFPAFGPAFLEATVYSVSLVVTSISGSFRVVHSGGGSGGPVISTAGTHTWTVYVTAGGTGVAYINVLTVGTDCVIARISAKQIFGNHATQATAASRPLLKQDVNGKYYLLFDGVNDSLATASIDFTATDKMTVVAGVRKLSDTAVAILLELTSDGGATDGGFYLAAPITAEPNAFFASRGTVSTASFFGALPAPVSAVLTGQTSISTPLLVTRQNGVQIDSNGATQGTGNYAASPLYIGSRVGSSLPFNGHIYSLIVRGAATTTSQIVSAETYVNGRTGAY